MKKMQFTMNKNLFQAKNRRLAIILILLIIAGLLTKMNSGFGIPFIYNNLGGIIYVTFWILFFSLFFPAVSPFKIGFLVLAVTYCIEFTQLLQHPVLETCRKNFFFRVLFGNSFSALDLFWYIPGAVAGVIILFWLRKEEK